MTITGITAKGIMADHNDLGMYIAHDRAINVPYTTHLMLYSLSTYDENRSSKT
jgi:hypothetical protein